MNTNEEKTKRIFVLAYQTRGWPNNQSAKKCNKVQVLLLGQYYLITIIYYYNYFPEKTNVLRFIKKHKSYVKMKTLKVTAEHLKSNKVLT